MFHASPTIERQSILTNGLTPNAPLGGYPSGVYLFPDEGNALFFAEHMGQVEREGYGAEASSYDVWLVDTSGLTLLADPAITDDDEFQRVYPAQPLRSVYTTHRVGPERLTLRVAGSMPGHTGGSMPEHTGLISFPGPEYLVPGQRYNWWSDTAEPWMITGEPRDFDPGPHITFATYRGPHRHEQYTRAVPAVAGHQFEIHQGNYDRRATTVRATKDDISDPFSARWENVHVMDEPQLRDIMARGLFQTYSDPAPIGEVMEGINMQIADHENRQEAATPMTLPEGWTHEGTSDHEWEPFTFPTGAQVHLNWETNQIRDPDGEEHDLDQWLRYGGSYRDSPSRYVEAPDFHKQFWDDPQYLFHGTDQENVAPILAHGLEPRNKTRGIDNRSIGNAVFTTPHESVASYHYGPTLGIDAPRMKADGYMPIVTSDGMDEAFHRHAVAEALDAHFGTEYGYEYRPETGTGGEDPDTVVFHDHIPAKYITHIDDPTHYSGADPEVARIAARLRSATPHKSGYESGDLYHVAPRGVAGDIESSGLRPRADDESGTMPEFPHVPGVVYAYANHEHAQRWADALDRDSVIYRLTGIPDHRLVPDHEELDDALNEHLNFSAPGDRGLRDALHGIAIDGQPLTMWWKQRVPRNDHGGARSVAAVAGMPEAAQAAAGQVLRQFGQRVAIKGPIEPHHLERLPEPPRNDVPMAPSTPHKADYEPDPRQSGRTTSASDDDEEGDLARVSADLDAGQRVWTPDGTLATIHRFYTTLPGKARAVVYPVGADTTHGIAEEHHDVDTLTPETHSGVGAAFGPVVTDVHELTPGDLLYGGSMTHEGQPNVKRVLTIEHTPYPYRGFTWQFVDPAEPMSPRSPYDREHFTWADELADGRHRRADDLAGGVSDIVPAHWSSVNPLQLSYHLTDDEHFALEPEREPRDNTFAIQDRSGRKGLYLTSDPMRWFNGHDYVRPFVAEIEHPPAQDERWGGEQFLTADQFPHSRVRRVLPLDEYVREEYNERGPFEEYEDPQPMFGPREKFPAYQYAGPDVREMPSEEVARQKARVQAYLRDVRPHMVGVDGRCPACGDPGELVLTPNPGEVSCNACGKRSPMPHQARDANHPVRPHHFNRRTGLPCDCHYGRPRPRMRTASQAVRQLRNQNQKALRTPEGQEFLTALEDISDRHDIESLVPWLSKQFKEGSITVRPPLGYGGLPSGANPSLYAIDAPHNHYPENIEYSLLPLWSQWMEARQHPLRRGRNIMQMGFDEVTALARDLREEVEARQIKKHWLEQYGGTGVARHTFNPSHADNVDEAHLLDRHRGWRVHELVDGEDCEAESDALNHCIGSDDQPYKQNVIRGNIRAFSLRDPDGFPRVAWHHNPNGSLAHIQGRSGDPKQEWRDLISHFNSRYGYPDHVVGEDHLDNRDEDGYDPEGYDEEGYDRDGYDEEGYDRYDYDRYGYDRDGYNEEGYDGNGYDRDGYDAEGYDAEGYDNAGFNEEGYDRDGYDEEGYDEAGYTRYGEHRDGPQHDETITFPEPTTVADYLDQYHPDHEDKREEYARENAEHSYDEYETQLVPGEPQFHDQYTWNGADPVQPGIVSELRNVHPDDRQNVYQTILHHHYDGGHPERFGDALAQQLRTQPNDPQTQAIAAEWETAWNRSHNPMTGAFVTPRSLGQVHRPDGTSYTDWSTAYDRQEPGFPLGDVGRYTEPATPFGPRSGSRPVIASARMSGGPDEYEIRPADEGWFSHDTGTFVPRRDSKGTDTLVTRHGQGEGRVAYFNGEPVASVTWQRTPNAILLGSAYTHPDHRGKGLFNRLTEDIRTSGLPVDAMVWENPWLKRKVRDWPRRTSAYIDWRPDSRIAMPIVPTRWDALRMPRAEYVGEAPKFPDRDEMAHGSPEYLAWLDRVGPEFKAIREREHEWDRAARNAMATGRMTPEEVVALGYRPDSHEMDSNSWIPYEKNIGKWRPLPQALYHVTSNLPGVLHTGGLLSPNELDLEGKGRGLGGGTQDTISLTESLEEAQNIQRAILEGADVASGRLPIERLVEMAERGEGAKEPWLRKIFGEHDWSKGNPRALDDLLLGRKPFYTHLLPDDHPLKGHGWQTVLPAEEWAQHGYYPYDDAYTLGTPDSPKYMANTVYRHLTPEEKAHEAFEWWRNPYAPMRASSGGPDDPLFTSVDPHWFANLDPSHVGILQVAPVPGAHGYPLSSLGEWRIPTGDAVKLTHVNGQPYEVDDPEHLGAVQANILDPIHETLDPAVFEDPHTLAPHLRPAQREWLLDTVFGILQDAGYEGTERWARLYLTGSLTTYQYADHSDCDISIFVNHHAFPEWSRAEMIALMVDSCDGLTLPGTPHELQVFVVAKSVEPSDLYKPGLRSGYDLIKDEWIVPPERGRAHDPEQEDPEGYVNGLLAADKMERLLTFEPERAKDYYAQLHRKRMRDQKDRKGDYAPSNLIYKMLANRGLFDRLRQLGVRVAAVAPERHPSSSP